MSLKSKETITVTSDTANLPDVADFAERIGIEAGLGESEVDDLAIAVTEAVTNAIAHGNKGEITKNVTITLEITRSFVSAEIRDEGNGFDPEMIRDPLNAENLLNDSGRGILIMRELMDEVKIEPSKSGTLISLKKKR